MEPPNNSEKPKEITQTTLTIEDLGWSTEKAAEVRGQLSAFADLWEDPDMDVYDEQFANL